MKNSASIREVGQEAAGDKSPGNLNILKGNKNDPMAFLKTCARKEGISFNDRIWSQIEEVVESHAL